MVNKGIVSLRRAAEIERRLVGLAIQIIFRHEQTKQKTNQSYSAAMYMHVPLS